VAFVLDASIAACWCFRDEADARAELAFNRLDDDTALVPTLWWFEIRNVVLLGERRMRISPQEVAIFLKRLARLTIDLAPTPENDDVVDLARKHRLTFYDAAYLELAKRERLALATLDDELALAARVEGIALVE